MANNPGPAAAVPPARIINLSGSPKLSLLNKTLYHDQEGQVRNYTRYITEDASFHFLAHVAGDDVFLAYHDGFRFRALPGVVVHENGIELPRAITDDDPRRYQVESYAPAPSAYAFISDEDAMNQYDEFMYTTHFKVFVAQPIVLIQYVFRRFATPEVYMQVKGIFNRYFTAVHDTSAFFQALVAANNNLGIMPPMLPEAQGEGIAARLIRSRNVAGDLIHVKQDIGFDYLIGMLALIMTKSTANAQNGLEQYIQKRITALSAQLGLQDFTTGYLTTPQWIAIKDIIEPNNDIRGALLSYLLSRPQGNKMVEYCLNLIRNSGMATAMFMKDFLEVADKTHAHIMPSILTEAAKFKRTLTKLEQEYGDRAIYYKILNPRASDFSNKNFPNLSYAAVLFFQRSRNNTNFKTPNAPTSGHAISLNMAKLLNIDGGLPCLTQAEHEEGLNAMGITFAQYTAHVARVRGGQIY